MKIRFEAIPYEINNCLVLRLPTEASAGLPSRGLTLVEGQLNDVSFQAPLEPDGLKSHWLQVDSIITPDDPRRPRAGEAVRVELEALKDWPEPSVPDDLAAMLHADPQACKGWHACTTRARWDWIRWIQATKNADTRQGRIDRAQSQLVEGKRRPCCFNAAQCTVQDVSKSGILLGPND